MILDIFLMVASVLSLVWMLSSDDLLSVLVAWLITLFLLTMAVLRTGVYA